MAQDQIRRPPLRPPLVSNDHLMAVWTGWILFTTMLIWTASGGSGGPGGATLIPADPVKYVIYSLPVSLGAAYYLSFAARPPRIDGRSFAALAMYWAVAITGMVANSWDQFYAARDVFIVTSYMLLFIFWFVAPPSLVDVALTALLACLAIEAASRIRPGLTLIDAKGPYALLGLTIPSGNAVFGPHSMLESTLGFPLGVVVLFYWYHRRWRSAAVAGVLQLLAFKRISFAGVAIAVAFDALAGRKLSLQGAKSSALALALALSVVAVFSIALIRDASSALAVNGSSPNGLSLGRYDIAVMLWDRLKEGSALNWAIGFGPGAADAVSQATADLNPHNDWLKILFDYGVLGSAAVHTMFFLMLARHRLGLMIYLYTATLMTTDNVFIYLYYYPFIAAVMCTQRGKA